MQHIIFKEAEYYKAAILIKPAQLLETDLRKYYLTKLIAKGISQDKIIAMSVRTNPTGKVTATIAKEYLNKALKALHNLGITTLFVCDATYFKVLTKKANTEPHYGYVVPCAIAGYEHMNIVLGVNYQAIYYNPKLQDSLDLGLAALANKMLGVYTPVGSSIIKTAHYPESLAQIEATLNELLKHPILTCDIETFSLDFWKAGIGTIAFAWNKNEGTAFTVDYKVIPDANTPGLTYANTIDNVRVKLLLRRFFDNYEGTMIYHNGNFDIKILVYELWMTGDFFATEQMLQGIDVLTKNTEDTKLIAYLATNATVGNNLKLKSIAQGFAGNYAQEDITDIRLIARESLLEYNLVDCLSTWFAFNKYYQTMCDEKQLEVYRNIMLPSVQLILQMELTGMPLDMVTVTKTENTLLKVQQAATTELNKSTVLQDFTVQLQKEEMVLKNLLLKVKVKPIEDFHHIQFNAKSNKHLRNLLYTFLGYDVIDTTKTGLPATGAKTLKKLLIKAKCTEHEDILNALIELAEVSILLNTFISSFKDKSVIKTDNRSYLHGNFNIGGTVSGRLSSSKPNMQNIPSTGTKYAKAIKECFSAPDGWIMVGADFSSLEDRISALTTKDPNKIKVYTDGFDGHCLRAYSYFGSQMPDIGNTVQEINSISERYPELRQASKAPTFLLTYGGTAYGLINNVGLSEEEAKNIEDNYHELYKVSDEWVKTNIDQATHDGYVTLAFGLRLRTPVLAATLLNKKSTPAQSKSEARTAGNALGQSYGLLNNRAGIEFRQRTLDSQYRTDILPIAHIHDSQYFLIKNNLGCLKWFNDNLIECMEWQELPEIKHDIVKLGGEVEVFHPTWADKFNLPNSINKSDILAICKT